MSFCLLGYDGIMCSGLIYYTWCHHVGMLLVNVVMVILVLGAGEVDSSGHVDRGLAALWPPVTIFRPSLRRPTTLRSMSTQL